jgi:hypothetical protein
MWIALGQGDQAKERNDLLVSFLSGKSIHPISFGITPVDCQPCISSKATDKNLTNVELEVQLQ